jgi:molybdopterin molybdotransferase
MSSTRVPPFDNSAMDGYAVIADDCQTQATQFVVGEAVMAGHFAPKRVETGYAMPIMTGAPIPAGATAVCPVERTKNDGSTVLVTGVVHAGDSIRRAGEDIEVGDVVMHADSVVGAVQVGVLASIGRTSVLAYDYPRVGVLSTGDELLASTSAAIHDSNRAIMLSSLKSDGVPVEDLGIVGDDVDALVKKLRGAAERCDVIITTGGVSVGDRDVVRDVLDVLTTEVSRRMMVAIKPAKPFAFAVFRASGNRVCRLIGLPGNPVSAFVAYELFARPAIRQLAGHKSLWRPTVPCLAEEDFERKADGKLHFVGAYVQIDRSGRLVVGHSGRQGAHNLTSLSDANGLVVLPDGKGSRRGERVNVLVFDAVNALQGPNHEAECCTLGVS